MTLYDFLVEQMGEHAESACNNLIGDDNEFYKDLGRIDMCDHIIKTLSDENLKMEVKTRHNALSSYKE